MLSQESSLTEPHSQINITRAYTVRVEVLTVVTMKSTVFWVATPSSSGEVHRQFGGPDCFHLQSRRVGQANNQEEGGGEPSTLKIEVACVSETSANSCRTARR
jgi:hypothetical protein